MPSRELIHRVEISAPPDRVWDILADVTRWPQWTPSVTRIDVLTPGPLAVGSTVRIRQPRLRPAAWKVTCWEPGRRFAWVTRTPGLSATAEHVVAACADGCTVTLALEFAGPLAGLAGFLAGGLTRRYMALEAAGLKARSEGTR